MKKVILFGASKMGEIAYTINKGNFIIEAFCDNDKKKWGKSFLGVPVISPDQLSLKEKIDDIHIIVTSIYKKEIVEQLKKLGITNVYCFNYEQYIEKVYPAKSEKEFSTQILLTDVGVKTTNQLLNSNNFIHDNLPCFSLPISKLKLGIDGLSDEFTNAYKSIKESPHLELINALLNNKEILKTNYIYRLENGTLDLRNKMLITNEFIKFTKDTFNKRINEFELGKISPIRVARVKDEWLVIDGKHRAALCYALGYQDIKVIDSSYIYSDSFLLWIYFLMNEHKSIFKKNLLIYKNLFEFKKGNKYMCKSESITEIVESIKKNPIEESGHIYHPIPFSEFSALKTSTNNDEFLRKWDLIKNKTYAIFNNDISDIKVLDIGANGGFFTFSLANSVSKVTAFEPHPRYGGIGKELVIQKGINNVEWHNELFSLEKIDNEMFDLTLMLSVFQWMADGGAKIKEASELLMGISKRSMYMIFELGYNAGKSSLKTDNPDTYQELINFLKNNTVYTEFELIGVSEFWENNKRHIVLCK